MNIAFAFFGNILKCLHCGTARTHSVRNTHEVLRNGAPDLDSEVRRLGPGPPKASVPRQETFSEDNRLELSWKTAKCQGTFVTLHLTIKQKALTLVS